MSLEENPIVGVELRYANGEIHTLEGDNAIKWINAINGPIMLQSIRNPHFSFPEHSTFGWEIIKPEEASDAYTHKLIGKLNDFKARTNSQLKLVKSVKLLRDLDVPTYWWPLSKGSTTLPEGTVIPCSVSFGSMPGDVCVVIKEAIATQLGLEPDAYEYFDTTERMLPWEHLEFIFE